MYLGDYIVIEKQIRSYSFSCSCVSTNTAFLAIVDEDKRSFFNQPDFFSAHPQACPFLGPTGDGRIVCTIHETSPVQCKIYRCVIFRIFNQENVQLGYVTGMGALHSDDPTLRRLYENGMKKMPCDVPDRDEWIACFFKEKGYLVM